MDMPTLSRQKSGELTKFSSIFVRCHPLFLTHWWAWRRKIWKFVTQDCWRMHLRAPKQLKISLKKSSTTTDIFDKSHDVVLKLTRPHSQGFFSLDAKIGKIFFPVLASRLWWTKLFNPLDRFSYVILLA